VIHSFPAVHSYIRELQRKTEAQTKVIDAQTKVIAKNEDHLAFITHLLYTNGLHTTECEFAQSMRANERHQPACTCWIAKEQER